jgi:Sulfotransferase domain
MADAVGRATFERELVAARAERDACLVQRDIALGERNEFLRQRDELLIECNRLRAELRPQLKLNPDRSPQNSIFITTLPKSGTVFLNTGILDATDLVAPTVDDAFRSAYLSGYCNTSEVTSTGVFVSERLVLGGLSKLAPNGYLYGSHCPATYHNLCVLRDAGFKKVTVVIRDPRDATVSWTHHLRKLGPSMRDFNSFLVHLPSGYFDWTHEAQLSFQVRTFLPSAVNWIESWVDAATRAIVDVHFIRFDEIRTIPERVFERTLRFHEVVDYDLSKIRPPQPGERHFRKGVSGSWRDEFSEADKAFAHSLIGTRLEHRFDEAAA